MYGNMIQHTKAMLESCTNDCSVLLASLSAYNAIPSFLLGYARYIGSKLYSVGDIVHKLFSSPIEMYNDYDVHLDDILLMYQRLCFLFDIISNPISCLNKDNPVYHSLSDKTLIDNFASIFHSHFLKKISNLFPFISMNADLLDIEFFSIPSRFIKVNRRILSVYDSFDECNNVLGMFSRGFDRNFSLLCDIGDSQIFYSNDLSKYVCVFGTNSCSKESVKMIYSDYVNLSDVISKYFEKWNTIEDDTDYIKISVNEFDFLRDCVKYDLLSYNQLTCNSYCLTTSRSSIERHGLGCIFQLHGVSN